MSDNIVSQISKLTPLYGSISITCSNTYGSGFYFNSVSLPIPSGYSRIIILNIYNKQDYQAIMATAQYSYSMQRMSAQTNHGTSDVVEVYYAWLP